MESLLSPDDSAGGGPRGGDPKIQKTKRELDGLIHALSREGDRYFARTARNETEEGALREDFEAPHRFKTGW